MGLETLTVMGVVVVAIKLGLVCVGAKGMQSGLNWFNSKGFKKEKGGLQDEDHNDTPRHHR